MRVSGFKGTRSTWSCFRAACSGSRGAICLLPLAVVFCVTFPAPAQVNPFYLHKDDRVVFYGDSITEQNRYGAFIETYVLTHYSGLNVRFINSGWSGDWVVGGGGGKIDERLARDVIANKPTVATFMLGMNDGAYQDFDQAWFDVYTKGYQHLLENLQPALPTLRITLLEPSPFDDVTRPPLYALHDGGYNKVVMRYGQFVRQFARDHNLMSIDLNAPLVVVLEKAFKTDPALAEKIVPDRIHPSDAGGLVIAATILKAWNAPAVVSAIEIDADRGRFVRSENCHGSDLQKKPILSWTQLDNALPLPLDPKDEALALVVRSSNVVESLDQQILKVTGLPDVTDTLKYSAKYALKIDGDEVGTWTRNELAQGVNLALLQTPMLKQALAVHALAMRRNFVRMARWQGVQVALQKEKPAHVEEALNALDALEDEIVQQQKAASAPTTHRYELIPQNSD